MRNFSSACFYAFFIAAFFVSSCTHKVIAPAPSACFSTGTMLTYSFPVHFTSCSQNGVSYSWTFGDGSTSADQNPQHIFAASGTYTVTLTTTGIDGQVNSTSKDLVITDGSNLTVNPGNYSKFYVTRVQVLNFPITDDAGNSWDGPGSQADVYVESFSSGLGFSTSSNYFLNAVPGDPIVWDFSSSPHLFNAPTYETQWVFSISCWDKDVNIQNQDISVQMAYIPTKNFYSPDYYGKPEITLTQGNFSVKLTLQWE
jgi:hypothetical protein